MSARARRTAATAMHAVMALLVTYAFAAMFARHAAGSLDGFGWSILKYFTVLSNIFQGLVSLVTCAWLVFGSERPSRPLILLNYAAAVSVGLTFFTVMIWLGPFYGYAAMFVGSNLHFHLIVPVLSMLTWCLLTEGRITAREILFGLIPMLLYGMWYIGNMAVNGIPGNDWYAFARGGWGGAAVSFVLMIALTAGIAALLRLPHGKKDPSPRQNRK
ncbi:MAG: hypothetical protein IKP10_04800 [Clostridia bacterium]|nr:hypothetical protein [Clostridia bacterium]